MIVDNIDGHRHRLGAAPNCAALVATAPRHCTSIAPST
jgi:hypothetical protein